MLEGCKAVRNLDVSVTTLAYLVFAAQYAMRRPDISLTGYGVLQQFASEAAARGDFPPEIRKLIEQGWAGSE